MRTPMSSDAKLGLLDLKTRSIFLVLAMSIVWSTSVEAGMRWVDTDEQACPDACNLDKGENGQASERNAVPIGGREQYYVCAGHISGSTPKDERVGSNNGGVCIVAAKSGAKTLTRYKCLCTSDPATVPLW